MSKYRPLADHFAARTDDHWRAGFAEIEAVLGAGLPKAAGQPAWWTGTDKPHQRAWLDHGWEVAEVGADAVAFHRTIPLEDAPHAALETAPADARLRQAAGIAALAAAAIAVVAGLGVLAAKLVRGRKRTA